MAESDRRQPGRGRPIKTLSDPNQPQIPSGLSPAVGQPLPTPAQPLIRLPEKGLAYPKPTLQPLQGTGQGPVPIRANLTQPPTKAQPLGVLPAQTGSATPLTTLPSQSKGFGLPLRASPFTSPLVVPALSFPQVGEGYTEQPLHHTAGHYTMEPDIEFGTHRFLTPSEL